VILDRYEISFWNFWINIEDSINLLAEKTENFILDLFCICFQENSIKRYASEKNHTISGKPQNKDC